MNKDKLFFNYYLGRELNVCGDLIYAGFEALENNSQNILAIDSLNRQLGFKNNSVFLQEGPAFIFWINNSIAFERLGKIIILFLMWKENKQSGAYEKTLNSILSESKLNEPQADKNEYELLMSHNNMNIFKAITGHFSYDLRLGSDGTRFLSYFTEFYNNLRYGRFHEKNDYKFNQDILMLKKQLKKYYQQGKKKVYMCHSEDEIALFHIGKVISDMAKQYYDAIKNLSGQEGLYTYELHSNSPASWIFMNIDESIHELFIWNRVVRNETTYLLMYDKILLHYNDIPQPLEPDDINLDFSNGNLFAKSYSESQVDSVREALYENMFENENINSKKNSLDKRERFIEGLISSEEHYKDYDF